MVAVRFDVPASLDWVAGIEGGPGWLAALPRMVEECAQAWQLDVGRPFSGSHVSLVLPALRRDGLETVLKLNFPHRESEHEATALARWDGYGAVRCHG